MQQFIYFSRSTRPLTSAELATLVQDAQQDNANRHVTGILFGGSGMLGQVLEGEPTAMQKLLCDPRHTDMLPLADKQPVARRSFAGWDMAFEGSAAGDYASVPGQLLADELARCLATLGPAEALLLRSLRRQLFTAA